MRDYHKPFKWFYEETKAEASKYSSITEFSKGCRGAYKSALNNGWLDEFFERKQHTPYTYEECFNAAKPYTSKVEFKENEPSMYSCARINGWLKDYTWLKSPILKIHMEDDYLIYTYVDNQTKSVYVGLTYQLSQRDRRHRNGHIRKGTRKYDLVNRFFKSLGKELPEPSVKMDGLSAAEAGYYEDWYRNKYMELGWNVINKAKTGEGISSLGGTYRKWNFDACLTESRKYKNRTEFCKKSGSAYAAARRNKWLDTFFPI